PTALALYLPLATLGLAVAIPVLRAMAGPVATGVEGMRGKQGVAVTSEGKSGWLRCEGSLWRYAAPEPLAPGDRVRIAAIAGLTAVVHLCGREGQPGRDGRAA
ncbi:MAG: hypothetical protein HY575_01860, partial [candidate division NC10 bacterium]|nr:hypothetical protein [candidate division NC10 bacterium]